MGNGNMPNLRGYIADAYNSKLFFPIVIIVLVSILILLTNSYMPAQLRLSEPPDYIHYYYPVGESIFYGSGITIEGMPATRYPPGMPLLVALSLKIQSITNIEMRTQHNVLTIAYAAGSALSLFFFLRELLGKTKWIWIPPLVLITYPFFLWLGQQPNSEIPFIFFFFLSVFLLNQKDINYAYAFLAGILAGFSMLIRPIAIGCGVLLAILFFCLSPKSLRQRSLIAVIFILGNIICVLPWELWVLQQTGELIPLSSGGAPSIVDGLTFGVNNQDYREQSFGLPEVTLPLMQEINAHRQELNPTGKIIKFMFSKLIEQPLEVSLLFLTKAFRSWYATDSGRAERYILLLQIPYILISVFAFYCCIQLGNEYKKLAVIIAGLILYYWLMTIFALSILRYMVPAMGLMFCTWAAIPEFLIRKMRPQVQLSHWQR